MSEPEDQTPPAAAAEEPAPDQPQGDPPPEILPALAALDAGDFLTARREAQRLLASSPDKEAKRAARDVLARLGADPWAVRATIAATVALALVTAIYVL